MVCMGVGTDVDDEFRVGMLVHCGVTYGVFEIE